MKLGKIILWYRTYLGNDTRPINAADRQEMIEIWQRRSKRYWYSKSKRLYADNNIMIAIEDLCLYGLEYADIDLEKLIVK